MSFETPAFPVTTNCSLSYLSEFVYGDDDDEDDDDDSDYWGFVHI